MNLADHIEHTLLKPDATTEELKRLFDEAKHHKFKGICINPINVKMAKNHLKDSGVKIITVVGFPLGANLPEVKAFETQKAIEDGADEIDMVISIQGIKNADWASVKQDIQKVREASQNKILKVIIETDLLSDDEIVKACEIAVEAKADFVKTSTGFVKNGIGAKAEDVSLMSSIVKDTDVKIKASGGIKSKDQALQLIEAGAVRLGTSCGVEINKAE